MPCSLASWLRSRQSLRVPPPTPSLKRGGANTASTARELASRVPTGVLGSAAVLIPILGIQLLWNGFADWMWVNVLAYVVVAYLIYGRFQSG